MLPFQLLVCVFLQETPRMKLRDLRDETKCAFPEIYFKLFLCVCEKEHVYSIIYNFKELSGTPNTRSTLMWTMLSHFSELVCD